MTKVFRLTHGAILLPVLGLVLLPLPGAAGDKPKLELVLQTGHTNNVTGVALSPDGMLLVTGSYDGTAIVWDTAGGKRLQTVYHASSVYSVALSADGKLVASGSGDKTAALGHASTGKKLQTFQHNGFVTHLALSG